MREQNKLSKAGLVTFQMKVSKLPNNDVATILFLPTKGVYNETLYEDTDIAYNLICGLLKANQGNTVYCPISNTDIRLGKFYDGHRIHRNDPDYPLIINGKVSEPWELEAYDNFDDHALTDWHGDL